MAPSGPPDHSGAACNPPETANNRVSAGHSVVDSRLRRLAELIARAPLNLVAREERASVYERHIVEGVALGEVLSPSGSWMDLGTGGGLPGLVLALCHPEVSWTLVDATAKKIDAVRAFALELELANVSMVSARAETLAHQPAFRGAFDGVVTRALAPLPTLVELARGFLVDGGHLVAVKGPAWRDELADAEHALRRLSLEVLDSIRLDNVARESWVVTMQANGAPPDGFPRRDGVPKADPLR